MYCLPKVFDLVLDTLNFFKFSTWRGAYSIIGLVHKTFVDVTRSELVSHSLLSLS